MEKSIDKIIPEFYYKYGKYVNTEKMIPYYKDGLLPVHRRILLGTYDIAKNNWAKTRNVIGQVVGHYHPHNLDKGPFTWAVQNGFLDGKGSWGSNVGKESIEAAADRYTNIKMNDETFNLAFKYIKHTEWQMGELGYEEPKFLPTMLPFCLMTNSELVTIAFGFKPQIPCYNKKDLINRLLYLLKIKKDKVIIKPFINNCDILSPDKDSENLLTKGSSKLEIIGKYKIDKQKMCIHIYSWNPRISYETLEKRIDNYKGWKLISNGDIGSNDDSTNHTNIRFEILRGRNKELFFDKMVESITETLKSNISYEIIVVDDNGDVTFSSVDKLLVQSFTSFCEIFLKYLKFEINRIEDEIKELNIIAKIKPYISTATVSLITDNIYETLSELTGLDKDKIKLVCEKYKINKLLYLNTDNKELKNKKKELEDKLINIKRECINMYLEMLK